MAAETLFCMECVVVDITKTLLGNRELSVHVVVIFCGLIHALEAGDAGKADGARRELQKCGVLVGFCQPESGIAKGGVK